MGRRSRGCSLAGLDEEVLSGGCSVDFYELSSMRECAVRFAFF